MVAEIPLFLVRDGRLVRRTGPRAYVPLPGGHEPARLMRRAMPPQEVVYLYDVDGVEAGAANHEFYQRLERERISPWIDPGCRTPEDAMDAFFAGAEVLTVRLETMKSDDLADFADIAEYEFHVAVRFPGDHPAFPVTAYDLRSLVGELHAFGVVVEADATTDPEALRKFLGLVQTGGIEATLLSTERLPWIRQLAKEVGVARLALPWEDAS